MSNDMTTQEAPNQSSAVPATVEASTPAAAPTYLKLAQPGSRQQRAFQRNFGKMAFDINELPKVVVPSQGATTWAFETIRGEENPKEIEGVILAMAHRGSLWQTENDIERDRKPVLAAISPWGEPLTAAIRPMEGEDDEEFGDIDPEVLEQCVLGEIDGRTVYDWNALPYTKWGTAAKGDGKRAKETVDVFLLRQGDTMPLRISIPPASLKDWSRAVHALPLSFDECVVGLSLEKVTPKKGPDYSRVVPRFINELSEAEADVVIDIIVPAFEASIKRQCLPENQVAALIESK